AQLLHILVANMDKSGALIASQATLAKLMETSTATTKRALSVLIDQAWIQTIRLGSDRGGALAYVVNSRIAWADSRENIRFARFNARVLVSS
ncbi:helix-turn-helix domain-containing protein, partial [Vibrio cholerae]